MFNNCLLPRNTYESCQNSLSFTFLSTIYTNRYESLWILIIVIMILQPLGIGLHSKWRCSASSDLQVDQVNIPLCNLLVLYRYHERQIATRFSCLYVINIIIHLENSIFDLNLHFILLAICQTIACFSNISNDHFETSNDIHIHVL